MIPLSIRDLYTAKELKQDAEATERQNAKDKKEYDKAHSGIYNFFWRAKIKGSVRPFERMSPLVELSALHDLGLPLMLEIHFVNGRWFYCFPCHDGAWGKVFYDRSKGVKK